MCNLNNDPNTMRDVLTHAKTIAVVGHSNNPSRPSYQIADFLRDVGYKVYPVNPTIKHINGEKVYASLNDIPDHIDIVDVFRRSEHVAGIVEESIDIGADTIWTQLGVVDGEAKQKALQAGLNVAMNLCIKIEYLRLNIKSKAK